MALADLGDGLAHRAGAGGEHLGVRARRERLLEGVGDEIWRSDDPLAALKRLLAPLG